MNDFAKIFNTSYGQVLAKIDSDDDEGAPEIRFYTKPEGLGVASISFGYEDSEEGWDLAESGFKLITQEMAETSAKQIYDILKDSNVYCS